MKGLEQENAMVVAMERLVTDSRRMLTGALGLVTLKLAAVRLMTETHEVETVRDTEALDRRLGTWYRETEKSLIVARDAIRICRDINECAAFPLTNDHADRITSLEGNIAQVEQEIESGKAEKCMKSYRRDPVFMYIHRRRNSGKSAFGPFRRLDRWLGDVSLYDYHAQQYNTAARYTDDAREWIVEATAEVEELKGRAAINAAMATEAEKAAETVSERAKAAAAKAVSALVAAIEHSLVEHAILDEEASCLIARERAALRVRAIIEGKKEEALPLARQLEQDLAEFERSRRGFDKAYASMILSCDHSNGAVSG